MGCNQSTSLYTATTVSKPITKSDGTPLVSILKSNYSTIKQDPHAKKKKQKELVGILRRPLSRAKSTKQNLLVQTISMQCFLTLERVITTTREKIDLLHDAFIIKCGASLIDVNYSSQLSSLNFCFTRIS